MNPTKTATILRLVGIGWYVAVCIGGGSFGGLWLDRQLELSPVFTLVGLGLGLTVAVLGMYRMLMAVLSGPSE